MSTDRIVLAYSGGLDTSVALRWLADEYGAEVIALLVDVGQGIDRELVERRAIRPAPVEVEIVDARDEFARDYGAAGAAGRRAVRGQVPAGVGALASADRAAPGRRRPRVRRRRGRPRLHRQGQRPGAVRGRRWRRSRPTSTVLAPVRDWGMTREQEHRLRRAARHRGHGQERAAYSIDQNLWGRSIECRHRSRIRGSAPPEDAYALTMATRARAARRRKRSWSRFEEGVPVSIDGEAIDRCR